MASASPTRKSHSESNKSQRSWFASPKRYGAELSAGTSQEIRKSGKQEEFWRRKIVIPSKVACQAVALCEGWRDALGIAIKLLILLR
jgi:hypothetical protein